MVQCQLICVGKLKESFYLDACKEYSKRLAPHCKLNIIEVPEERLPDHPSQAQIDAALFKEALLIQEKLAKGTQLLALCVEGQSLSSEGFSLQIQQWMVSGVSSISLVIGGSFGLHPSIKEQAALRLSLSKMTFPHHLARVMVLEQIYRAFQIHMGTRYHK